jgi:hypothetical protein
MTDEAAVPHPSRAAWKLVLRLVVSVALLAVLVAKASDLDTVIPNQHHALTAVLLVGAVLTAFVGVVLSAWRWQRTLYLFDTRVPIPTLTMHYLVGLFVGNVLPSTIGGDVVRVARSAGSTGSATTSFGSVALERLTGFVALPALVFAGFALQPSLLGRAHAWLALLVAGTTLAFLAIVLFVAGHPRIAGRYADHENWMRFIGAVHRGVDALRRDPRQLVPVLGTALIYQISVTVVFALIFRALDLPVPIAAVVAFTPAVLMLQVLPISLSGLGVREGALVLFLGSFLDGTGIADSRLIAAGLLWYGCMLVVSMLGAPAFAIGQRKAVPAEDHA